MAVINIFRNIQNCKNLNDNILNKKISIYIYKILTTKIYSSANLKEEKMLWQCQAIMISFCSLYWEAPLNTLNTLFHKCFIFLLLSNTTGIWRTNLYRQRTMTARQLLGKILNCFKMPPLLPSGLRIMIVNSFHFV